MTAAHIIIAIIVIPMISGFFKGWSSTCKRTNYLTSMEMTKARFEIFDSEYETNARIALSKDGHYEHDVSSPEIFDNELVEESPITFTASEIPQEMSGPIDELLKDLSVVDDSFKENEDEDQACLFNPSEQVTQELDDDPDFSDQQYLLNDELLEMDIEDSNDPVYTQEIEESNLVIHSTNYDMNRFDEITETDIPGNVIVDELSIEEYTEPEINVGSNESVYSQQDYSAVSASNGQEYENNTSIVEEETIDQMLESLENKSNVLSNVIPFPCDIELLQVPSVISEADYKAIERRYGSVVASAITTTPQYGGSGSSIDVMVGRLSYLDNERVLQYGDHKVIIRGSDVSHIEIGQVVLVKGQFVSHSLFLVSMTELLEEINFTQNSQIG